ncbi:hypothetical protein CBOM_00812 [Ceraceosorus bombacis]|uniref:Uncharacterized protein n=1 Tax=Ceraceosorus bombacis TaxID=401625 RepID=A0A0P1BB00_9BASI|nr:hypothetical protein CBOM_00812 [Ceraceosorus bombacis]
MLERALPLISWTALPPGTHLLLSSTRPSAPDVYLCASAVNLLQNPRPSASPTHIPDPTSSSTLSHARVIWVDCLARGSEEIKGLCKRLSGKGLDWKGYAERVQVVDAYDVEGHWTAASAGSVHVAHRDAWSEELHRLLRRLESLLQGAAKEEGHAASHAAKCLVVLDDLNTLAWGTASPRSKISSSTSQGADRQLVLTGAQKEPQRLLAEGMTAWVEELRLICERNSAALITHLHADHTSILDDAHQGISREREKAARGAGQGFDADDAGEEDADTNIAVQVETSSSESSSDEQGNARVQKKAVKTRPPIRAAFVDAFDDALFLGALKNADVWVEMRSLRSGRAVDCHGELHPRASRPLADHA